MTPEAHRELDHAVAVHLFAYNTLKPFAIPAYSSRIEDAWKVHQRACSWIFSKRKAYYMHLRIIASELAGIKDAVVDWPDVLGLCRDNFPEVCCRAALAVANPQPAPAKALGEKAREVRGMLGRDI